MCACLAACSELKLFCAVSAPALVLLLQLRDRALRLVTRVPHDLEVLGDADRIVQVRCYNALITAAANCSSLCKP